VVSLGYPIGGEPTLTDMRERTPFGERLYMARTHAKLSQTRLAELAGMSQGNLGELEWKADGSVAAVRLAMACGVRPEWLAEGEGEMVDRKAWPFTLVTRDEILDLTAAQLGVVEGAMLAALARMQSVNAEDLQAFSKAHVRKVSGYAKKRAR
jgi:transcriptional regulator with XRE-family HTH domain